MGESMIAGLLRKRSVNPTRIAASHPRKGRREELTKAHRITVFEGNADAARSVAEGHNCAVVICVKPQRLAQVLNDLKGVLRPDQLIISIVAGATVERLADELGTAKIVRAMPNTPSQIGAGITAWTCTTAVDEIETRTRSRNSLGVGQGDVRRNRKHDRHVNLIVCHRTYVCFHGDGGVDGRRRSPRLFPRHGKGTRPGNDARLGKIRDCYAQTSRRTPQYGHLARWHVGRSYLPDGKRRGADSAVKSGVRSVQTSGRIGQSEIVYFKYFSNQLRLLCRAASCILVRSGRAASAEKRSSARAHPGVLRRYRVQSR